MPVILFTFTVCGTSGKEDLQEPVTDTTVLTDTESVQQEAPVTKIPQAEQIQPDTTEIKLIFGDEIVFEEAGSGFICCFVGNPFAATHENVMMVLSGMGHIEQTKDNISYMQDFQPLSEKEMSVLKEATDVIREGLPFRVSPVVIVSVKAHVRKK